MRLDGHCRLTLVLLLLLLVHEHFVRRHLLLHSLPIIRLRHLLKLLLLHLILHVSEGILLLMLDHGVLHCKHVLACTMYVLVKVVHLRLARVQHLLDLLICLVVETTDFGATAGRAERLDRSLAIRHGSFAALRVLPPKVVLHRATIESEASILNIAARRRFNFRIVLVAHPHHALCTVARCLALD